LARVRNFHKESEKVPKSHPTEVTCHWSVLRSDNGKVTLLQLDTRGSDDREKPDKQSQTLQFDRTSAKELFDILRYELGF